MPFTPRPLPPAVQATVRRQHGEGYYAAFIRDPDDNRIEAVTFVK
jgi:hypothetical protein